MAGLSLADSSSTGYSRGLCSQMAKNERHFSVPPSHLYKNRNFDLKITLLTLYLQIFTAYLRKLHVALFRLGLAYLEKEQ